MESTFKTKVLIGIAGALLVVAVLLGLASGLTSDDNGSNNNSSQSSSSASPF